MNKLILQGGISANPEPMAYKVLSGQITWNGTDILFEEFENTLPTTYNIGANVVGHLIGFYFVDFLPSYGKILFFCNGGFSTADKSYSIKGNYSYEENIAWVYGYHNNVGDNEAFSDTDLFYRTSFELRLYPL